MCVTEREVGGTTRETERAGKSVALGALPCPPLQAIHMPMVAMKMLLPAATAMGSRCWCMMKDTTIQATSVMP